MLQILNKSGATNFVADKVFQYLLGELLNALVYQFLPRNEYIF